MELKMELTPKKMAIWGVLIIFFAFTLLGSYGNFKQSQSVSLSQMVQEVREGKVQKITVEGANQITISYRDGTTKQSTKEASATIVDILGVDLLSNKDIAIEVKDASANQVIIELLFGTILPIVVMGGILLFIFRQARGSQDGIMGFGRSKAKLFAKGKQDVKFKDVGGMQEAKSELEEIVDFLKHPKKYHKLGARTPRGALLVGPSGTGKTLLARAVAGEANAPFFSMAGSEFMEMLVGVGASRVRDLFKTAKRNSPSIIFIDEIDAIGRMRGLGTAGGHDEREQTLNQILVEMDGFTPNDNVIVLAATNRGDLLDPALTRPGRFDRRVMVGLPDIEERKRILLIHAANKPFETDVNWDRAAKRTVGFSGADLENMLNEAAIQAARENRDKIKWSDVEEAAMKVKLGPEKKRLQDDYERSMTAYHEAGHAIAAHLLPHADPVHRVSIVSRGMALGYTLTPPEQDKYQQTRSELLEDIVVLLGGRTAEKLVFNELTGGASSDIDRATKVARAMVVDYGMSDTLGPVNLGPQYDTTTWGRAAMEPSRLSETKQALVDEEIAKIIQTAQKQAEKLLTKHRKELDKVAQALLAHESLDQDDFEALMNEPKAKPVMPPKSKR
jgi:cell division protease FtsH